MTETDLRLWLVQNGWKPDKDGNYRTYTTAGGLRKLVLPHVVTDSYPSGELWRWRSPRWRFVGYFSVQDVEHDARAVNGLWDARRCTMIPSGSPEKP